jgi:hypothetical protein
LQLADADQAMRKQAVQHDAAWDTAPDPAHQRRLGEIVDQIGWPTIPLVGPEASQAAWQIAQRAPDLGFTER